MADTRLRLRRALLVIGLASCLSGTVAAANDGSLRFTQLSMADGLSQDLVYSMVQDSKGFLWIGTAEGLSRHDGYGFKVYRNDPDDPQSLVANKVRVVYVDRSGVLWVGTDGGLDRFNSRTETFTHYRPDPLDASSLGDDDIRAIYEDSKDRFWIGTESGGLSLMDRASGSFSHYRHDPEDSKSIGSDDVRAIVEGSDGLLWIGTNRSRPEASSSQPPGFARGGLVSLNLETGEFTHYDRGPSRDDVRALYEDRHGSLWIGNSSSGLDRLDFSTGLFTTFRHDPTDPGSLSNDDVRAIFEDSFGHLWIGTHGGGLSRFDRSTESFEHHRSDPYDSFTLGSNDIRNLYEDRSGVLWLATYGAGISRLDQQSDTFSFRSHDPSDPRSLSDNMVHVLYEDRSGTVWVGTENGGLNSLDRESGEFTHYKHHPNDARSLSGNDVRAIHEDNAGGLWIGTNNDGLNRFDRARGVFSRYQRRGRSEDAASDDIRAILEDSTGRFWVGFNNEGLDLMDRVKETFDRAPIPIDLAAENRTRVRLFFEDRSRRLWIGLAEGGLLRMDLETKGFSDFRHAADDPSSLQSDGVRAIYQDSSGVIWIGTTAGLSRFDEDSASFTHPLEPTGLASDTVQAILEDDAGMLWLSTDAGVSRFDPSNESVRSYPISYGRRRNALHPSAAIRTSDGEIVVAGRNGVVWFDPAEMQDRKPAHSPALVFTSLAVAGDQVDLDTSITEAEEISLTHRDRSVSFEFAVLDLKYAQSYNYSYRLSGLHKDWIDLGKRRDINFNRLEPGSYTLRIRAGNIETSESIPEATVTILVAPPYWATWWFRIAAAITVLALLTLIYKRRTRTIRIHNAALHAEIRERELVQTEREGLIQQLETQNAELERFTYTVSHDLKSPLVTIQGFVGALKKDARKGNMELVEHDIQRISTAAKTMKNHLEDLLELSRVGRVMNPPVVVSLSHLALEAAELVSGRTTERGVDVSIDPDMPTVEVDRMRVREVFQNLLENATKFMGDQTTPIVEVGATQNGGEVVCHVRDNGAGIKPQHLERIFGLFDRLDQNMEGTGIGLALVKRIIEVHGGRIWAESDGPGKGSTFHFALPVKNVGTHDTSPLEVTPYTQGSHA